ncbi:MAG TPA: hypothetical protein VGL71_14130, partial [Urbifossiella sp.]
MSQFLAILKDSFREAVDGFVIYVMLFLSAFLIVLLGSISYQPEAPAEALPKAMSIFGVIFPNRGASNAPTASPIQFQYKAAEIEETSNGAKFLLEVDPRIPQDKKGADGKIILDASGAAEKEMVMPKKGSRDGFR